jgi:hypothetical protein
MNWYSIDRQWHRVRVGLNAQYEAFCCALEWEWLAKLRLRDHYPAGGRHHQQVHALACSPSENGCEGIPPEGAGLARCNGIGHGLAPADCLSRR